MQIIVLLSLTKNPFMLSGVTLWKSTKIHINKSKTFDETYNSLNSIQAKKNPENIILKLK